MLCDLQITRQQKKLYIQYIYIYKYINIGLLNETLWWVLLQFPFVEKSAKLVLKVYFIKFFISLNQILHW